MSKSRHRRPLVRGYSITHPPGQVLLPTEPGWDQLLLAHSGLFTAHTHAQAWTVPGHRAICVPDGHRVHIETSRRVAIRCLYTRSTLALFGDRLRVVNLKPLTKELIYHAIRSAPMNLSQKADAALLTLLTDQINQLHDARLHLPFPVDSQARSVARAIMSEPAASLERHLKQAAMSRRTLERRFRTETQMSLGQWRRRACILASIPMLTEGTSVTSVAYRVGYSSASSFIAAFRSELDAPPREFTRSAQLN